MSAGRGKRAGRRPSGHPGSRRVASRIFASKTSTAAAPSSIPARVRIPLFVGLCILILSIIVNPLRGYLAQRHELASLQQKVAAAQLRNDKLRAELERWDNEDVVRREARTRLGFVAPGETVFVVLDSQTLGGLRPAPTASPSPLPADAPWYDQVWSGQPARPPGKLPSSTPTPTPSGSPVPSEGTSDE